MNESFSISYKIIKKVTWWTLEILNKINRQVNLLLNLISLLQIFENIKSAFSIVMQLVTYH